MKGTGFSHYGGGNGQPVYGGLKQIDPVDEHGHLIIVSPF